MDSGLQVGRPHVGKKIGLRWAWETERLEEKFDAIKNRDEAIHSQLAPKWVL